MKVRMDKGINGRIAIIFRHFVFLMGILSVHSTGHAVALISPKFIWRHMFSSNSYKNTSIHDPLSQSNTRTDHPLHLAQINIFGCNSSSYW